jgi:metal transporter CNNM
MMTLVLRLLALSSDTLINDMIRYDILKSGCRIVPVYMESHSTNFVGVLVVTSFIDLDTEEEITVGQLTLDVLPIIRADASYQELFRTWRHREVKMILVTRRGVAQDEPLGIVTARDLMEVMIRGVDSPEHPYFTG